MAELGEASRKRSREEETATDRLSHLPDSIIHHILSLLDDTKSAVRTCVLSPLWRFAWKHAHILDFRRSSFQNYSSFCRCVDQVLYRRNPFIDARKISYTDKESYEDRDRRLLIRVIQYAASHGTQHLVIDVDTVLANYDHEIFRFSQFFAPNLDSNLKTLEFRGMVALDVGMDSPGFRNVTTLDMDSCLLSCDEGGDTDPFSHFPCLENLSLKECHRSSMFYHEKRSLRISGHRLLSLKLVKMDDCKIEIFAPKLKFFSLWSDWPLGGFTGFSLPSLEHASIQVYDIFCESGRKELVERHLISLFRGLHNAKSLKLHWWTVAVLSEFYELLEQPSPLKRLESLIVDAESIPFKLTYYFLKGDIKTGTPPGLSILRISPEAQFLMEQMEQETEEGFGGS